ncbi:hypothetical protein L6164_003991 [Bauhinia variegata]|uniref:Uncharacterized protein n=1 Tax=Bauhinia variegata TaxID=167791 RepID=A0ACB9Q2H5_BAUVA|nr:hypothetical protein L6164_003991 [Bauhinia variegata]
MTANGGTGTEEHKRKANGCNLNPGWQQSMLRSPRMRVSVKKDWPIENATSDEEDKNLTRYLSSLAGSGPPSTSFCSTTDTELTAGELNVRNYKNPNLTLVSHLHGSKQCLRDKTENQKQVPFRVSKEAKGIDSDFLSLKSSFTKKITANTTDKDKTIDSTNALVVGRKKNSLSTYNFPQLKGKGVICKDDDTCIGFGEAVMNQEGETPTPVTNFHSDTLLRSDADDNKPCLQRLVKSSTESFDDGINLREWLKQANHKIDKTESLHIFKQVLEFADSAHSQGIVLQDFGPSCFILFPSGKVNYIGSPGQGEVNVMSCNVTKKRPLEQDMCASCSLGEKQPKLCPETSSLRQHHHFSNNHGHKTRKLNHDSCTNGSIGIDSINMGNECENSFSCQHIFTGEKQSVSDIFQLEKKWYSSPEELSDGSCTFSSNIYSLGVLLFELLCNIDIWEKRSAAMSDLRYRILPPRFLSEHPKEAGFCLWLLHPEPSSRPNTRMTLQSELIFELEELHSGDDVLASPSSDAETDGLLSFLVLLEEEKQKQIAKLSEEISCLDGDIKEVERRYSFGGASLEKHFPELRINRFNFQDPFSSDTWEPISRTSVNEAMLMRNINQLQEAYFSMRSQILFRETATVARHDQDVLKNRGRLSSHLQNNNEVPRRSQKYADCLGSFFEGLCKFVRYSKFEERGTLRNRDLLNSANVICALSFDRDEDYIAAAGVSKRIKIFDFSAILSDSVDIHYPIVEMSNKSNLSCVCWNSYMRNHLASTDYDGVVQMWDASTGQPFSQYTEHQKRAWSVHFSHSDPKLFASGSDDSSVKLWNINEKSSLGTIWNPANVCCVQFSPYSTNLLFFGSADYKINGYDLRHTRIPWCTLAGHGKSVSYVKFVDAETLASASTDNTLKLWDLKKTISSGLSSSACDLTFKGHRNEKNFVGLTAMDGYIACGSETNEVYCYHRSLPVPITAHKFGSVDPISGRANNDDNGQFVSSVCWREKTNMLVAANSIGVVKLLQMV